MRERQFIPRGESDLNPTQAELGAHPQRSKGKRKKRLAMTAAAAAGLLIGGEPAQAQQKLPAIMRGAEIAAGVIQTGQWTKTERERIAAEERAQQRREETERQRTAVYGAREAGWKNVEIDTAGGKTTIDVKRGGKTPEERMEAERNAHAETMYTLQNTVELNKQLREAIEAGDTAKAGPLALELARREAAQKRAEQASQKLREAR